MSSPFGTSALVEHHRAHPSEGHIYGLNLGYRRAILFLDTHSERAHFLEEESSSEAAFSEEGHVLAEKEHPSWCSLQ